MTVPWRALFASLTHDSGRERDETTAKSYMHTS